MKIKENSSPKIILHEANIQIYKPTRISSLTKVKMKGCCHIWVSREVSFPKCSAPFFQRERKSALQNTAQIFNFTHSFAGNSLMATEQLLY